MITSRLPIQLSNVESLKPVPAAKGQTNSIGECGCIGVQPGYKPLPKGEAAPSLDLYSFDDPLKVQHHPDGSMIVTGFPAGAPPTLKSVLAAAFPEAKEIEVVSSSHMRPFDNYHVLVDGKPFTASFLFGGFLPSDQFAIEPGHKQGYGMTPYDQDPEVLIETRIRKAPPILQVETDKTPDFGLKAIPRADGGFVVKGFPYGKPPSVETVLKAAFPAANEIKVLSSEHGRPFDTYYVEVDGKEFTASFLYGGFLPSGQFDITPGHGRSFGQMAA